MEWIASAKRFEAIDRETANLIKTTTGTDISFDEEGEMINMGNAWNNSLERAKNEGKIECRMEERVNSIRKMMQKLNLTAKQAMDVLDIPAAEQEKYAAQV